MGCGMSGDQAYDSKDRSEIEQKADAMKLVSISSRDKALNGDDEDEDLSDNDLAFDEMTENPGKQ